MRVGRFLRARTWVPSRGGLIHEDVRLAEARQEHVLWTSPSTLRITCTVMARQEVTVP